MSQPYRRQDSGEAGKTWVRRFSPCGPIVAHGLAQAEHAESPRRIDKLTGGQVGLTDWSDKP